MNLIYHKIDTLFEREKFANNKLIIGSWRNPAVEFLKDLNWIGTEKIDGTNIRVYWDGHKISFWGRSDNADIPKHLLKFLEDKFGGEVKEQMFEQLFGEKEVILYGEGYGAKIQNGGLYRSDVSFILFDVMINGKFLQRKAVETIASDLGIDVVPVVVEGTIEEIVKFVSEDRPSTIGKARMEGVVATPEIGLYDENQKRVIVKIKHKDFKEISNG